MTDAVFHPVVLLHIGPPGPWRRPLRECRSPVAYAGPRGRGWTGEKLFRESGAELGISLGNSYITPGIFNIPRLGMINIHHELLPAFQNAQSIILQLYHGSDTTGFTIHAIDRRIDTGNILLQRAIPIKFGPTLPATITQTMAALIEASREGLVHRLRHFPELAAQAKPQGRGTAYTTPSLWQFLRIKRNWKKLVKGKVQTAQPSRD